MNVLVTLNHTYIPPLTVMMTSLLQNNSDCFVNFYILHSSLNREDFAEIARRVPFTNYHVVGVEVPREFMADAPVLFHYTKEMYYRIFAAELLPRDLNRALYLDPDMIIMGSLAGLYAMELSGKLFAAARSPNPITQVSNRKRLNLPETAEYFNSGVLLINLAELRKRDDKAAIMEYITTREEDLLMPDQDVLNAFYHDKTAILDPNVYNFDARYYPVARLLPPLNEDSGWLERNTVIIHYCGKRKPWHKNYAGQLGRYYRQYRELLRPGEADA